MTDADKTRLTCLQWYSHTNSLDYSPTYFIPKPPLPPNHVTIRFIRLHLLYYLSSWEFIFDDFYISRNIGWLPTFHICENTKGLITSNLLTSLSSSQFFLPSRMPTFRRRSTAYIGLTQLERIKYEILDKVQVSPLTLCSSFSWLPHLNSNSSHLEILFWICHVD